MNCTPIKVRLFNALLHAFIELCNCLIPIFHHFSYGIIFLQCSHQCEQQWAFVRHLLFPNLKHRASPSYVWHWVLLTTCLYHSPTQLFIHLLRWHFVVKPLDFYCLLHSAYTIHCVNIRLLELECSALGFGWDVLFSACTCQFFYGYQILMIASYFTFDALIL